MNAHTDGRLYIHPNSNVHCTAEEEEINAVVTALMDGRQVEIDEEKRRQGEAGTRRLHHTAIAI